MIRRVYVMITSRKELKFYIQQDQLRNMGTLSLIKKIQGWLLGAESYRVCQYLYCLRHIEYWHNVYSAKPNLFSLICKMYWQVRTARQSAKTNIEIGLNVVGYGFRIPHIVGGVIIHCKSIGYNCQVNSGVVVGIKYTSENMAVIGNNVELCVGAKVIGKVCIGDNVIVAPNAVVIHDVPSNSIVGGVPAKILKTQ